jgi:hypothetical protein
MDTGQIDENGNKFCPLPTTEQRNQISSIQELMNQKVQKDLQKDLQQSGGGWGLMNTINCKMKCHIMCGAMITLAVTGSVAALYSFYENNQDIFQNAIEYIVETSKPVDKELADAVSNQEAGLKCFDKEFIEKKEEMNAIYAAIGEELLKKIKTNFTAYYDELYNDLNNRYKFCPAETKGGYKKTRKSRRKGKKSRKNGRKKSNRAL